MPEKILITGRAGSGKTRSVLDRAADWIRQGREAECLLLLPTQGQVDHVKGLLLRETGHAFRDLFAHTFFTFCRMLFPGPPEALLSEEGRDFLLGDLLEGEKLPAFEGVREFGGFRRILGETFQELKDNGVTPEKYAREILRPLGGDREAEPRHRDLGKALAAYQRLLQDRGRRDKEDLFLGAVKRLEEEAALLSDRKLLLVDGFHDFTPVQFHLLRILSARIPESVVTLSFDVGQPDRPPFQVSAGTRAALRDLGFLEQPRKGNHRTADPTLRRVEEGLFAGGADKIAAGNSLRILRAPRRETEVEGIARAILRLAREQGVPWSDIAVLFHDLGDETDLVEGTFERFGIPVRVYQPRPLDRQPVVRFLLDLGGTLSGPIDSDRFVRLLRSGYVARLPHAEVDRLDACLREIPAPAVMGEWQALALKLDLPGVKRALKSISETRERIATRRDSSRFGKFWRELFRALALPGGLEEIDFLGESGPHGPRECAAIEAFWSVVEEAQTRREGGSGNAGLAAFLKDIEQEAAEATFRPRDRRRDVVNVISAREARQWEVPCLFVAGVLERRFPPMPAEGLFFDDADRRRLNATGLRFPDRAWRQEEERFLFYTAVTRARDRVILSYPAADDRGNPTLPSFFLREIGQLFSAESLEGCTTRLSAAAVVPSPLEMTTLEDVDRAVLMGLETRSGAGEAGSRETPLTIALYNRRLAEARFRHRLDALLEPKPPRLEDPGILGEVASAEVAFSNSALTSFLQCPYLHFVEKWLRLEPLPERDLDPRDLGNVIHAALRDFFRSKGKGDPLELLDRHFEELSAAKRRSFRLRAEFWRLRGALRRFLPGEIRRNRELGLSPELLEYSFGGRGSGSTSLSIELQGRTESFSGKIDRVDTLSAGGAAVVVDYKYSAGGTAREQLKASVGDEMTNFQLALYLLAVRTVLEREPAGAELVALKKKVERYGIGRREILDKAGLSAALEEDWELVGEDDFRAFLDRAKAIISGLVRGIRSGDIFTKPADLTACGPGVCSAADICRYDRWLGGKRQEE